MVIKRGVNMDMQNLIKRINELSKKKRTAGLNDEEKLEQAELYKKYLAMIRGQVKGYLDNIEIIDQVKH
jgi:uncharacterized protein YnzC (UPF0291/DUF896 family)